VVQRALVRHGFSRDLARALVRDLRASVRFLQARPTGLQLRPVEATGYHH
jgi:hypothetical protein